MAPFGTAEEHPQAVEPAHRPDSPADLEEVVHLCLERIEALERLHQSVDGLLALLDVRAEEAIPDAKGRRVVPVQVAGIDRVMHAMLRRGVEDPFVPAEPSHQLRMDPELVQRAQRVDDEDLEEDPPE